MIDIKKLEEFQSEIEKISYEICRHATADLKAMKHRPDNPNFIMGE